jgi:hypothetical protein
MIVARSTISTVRILQYQFEGEEFPFPVLVKAEVMDTEIKCLIRSGNTQEAISAKNWGLIREFIEKDIKIIGK